MKFLKISTLLVILVIFFGKAGNALAHVRYLITDSQLLEQSGRDDSFLLSALQDKTNLLMMAVAVVVLIIVYIIAIKVPWFKKELAEINERADGYAIFSPWILRLSLGVSLIGSGVAETIVSPALSGYGHLAFLQILVGFFLMAGFLVVPSTVVAIGIYIFAFTQDWYIFGNLDFLVIALSLLILDNEKPGLDHLFGLPKISPLQFLKRYIPLILRVGSGGALMFLAVYEKFMNPHISEIIVLDFGLMNAIPVSPEMWVLSAGIIEFIIGLSLVIGFRTRISSAIAFITLSLSFFYFGEDVSSHVTIFGVLAILFITRGGVWSVDCINKRVNYEFIC